MREVYIKMKKKVTHERKKKNRYKNKKTRKRADPHEKGRETCRDRV